MRELLSYSSMELFDWVVAGEANDVSLPMAGSTPRSTSCILAVCGSALSVFLYAPARFLNVSPLAGKHTHREDEQL